MVRAAKLDLGRPVSVQVSPSTFLGLVTNLVVLARGPPYKHFEGYVWVELGPDQPGGGFIHTS